MKRALIFSLLVFFISLLGITQTRDLLIGSGPGGGTPPKSVYQNSWALLIAVDNYKYVPKLKYAVADAEAMKQYLSTAGGFPAGNIKTLYNEQATMANIKTAIG